LPEKIPVSHPRLLKKLRVPVIMKHPPHPKTAILIPAPAGFFIGMTALQNGLFNPVISCWISAAAREFLPASLQKGAVMPAGYLLSTYNQRCSGYCRKDPFSKRNC
jgi:hypothetical protein